MIVTIDGPAGAGKSTAARQLAQRLGFEYLDTGAMYRAVTWFCLREGVDLTREADVTETTRRMAIEFRQARTLVNGEDVSDLIRTQDITDASQHVAGNVGARTVLVELQRKMGAGIDLVSEGRDQGTVVFPLAECKFFITADPRVRAARRQAELAARGIASPLDELLALQAERDRRDAERPVGALRRSPDAVLVDTSYVPLDEVVDQLEAEVRRRLARQ